MSAITIPAKKIFTCDRCGTTGEPLHSGAFEYEYAHMRIAEGGKDCMGNSGGGNSDLDLCGSCHVAFKEWMKSCKSPNK